MSEGHSLLIVEDDVDVADMLEDYFRVEGYDVSIVNWGEDAVSACQENPPDLVILDIRLPDVSGYDVARRLREDRHTHNIPIIFLTEKREREDRLKGLGLGVDDYITKPFDIHELRLRVRNALRLGDLPSLLHPVTGLPEPSLTSEMVERALKQPGWALLAVRLGGLEPFRETYGFLASDDALRAVSLMIGNIVREVGEAEDFVGHLQTSDFIVATNAAHVRALEESITQRLNEALVYFYPLSDRPDPSQAPKEPPLTIRTASATAESAPTAEANSIQASLLERLQV